MSLSNWSTMKIFNLLLLLNVLQAKRSSPNSQFGAKNKVINFLIYKQKWRHNSAEPCELEPNQSCTKGNTTIGSETATSGLAPTITTKKRWSKSVQICPFRGFWFRKVSMYRWVESCCGFSKIPYFLERILMEYTDMRDSLSLKTLSYKSTLYVPLEFFLENKISVCIFIPFRVNRNK